jgi:formylglycine-generating enzyme required for sulfatase activity
MNTPLAWIATLVLLTAGSAQAQDVLQPGRPTQGFVPQGQAHCFTLVVEPGSQWRVDLSGNMDTYLEVGRGTCDRLTVDVSNDDIARFINYNSRVTFTAGGGAYIVKVQGYGGAAGQYTVIAQPIPGQRTRAVLPAAGVVGPWFQPGWTPPSVSAEPSRNGEGLAPGTIFADCADICPQLVVIPAGSFTMGSPAEEIGRDAQEGPRHPVAFAYEFAIGRYEVTFAQFDACVDAGGCSHRPNDQGWGRGNRPVVDVSWNDAMEYVTWLSNETGQRYTLPSESEWEYAARAGTNTPWHTGNAILTDDANILNAFARTVAVGAYPPNAFGLHDVHGNVAEWVLDCRDTGYVGVPNNGAAATNGDCTQQRIVRDGDFTQEPARVRSAMRRVGPQINRYVGVGFRVARAM